MFNLKYIQVKNILRNIARRAGGILPLQILKRFEYPVLLPFYHVVSNDRLPHVQNYPYRTEKEFAGELDFLLKHYSPVGLGEILHHKVHGRDIFHLSFDDGMRQCHDVIAPVLLRKGVPATFFLSPGFIGNQQLFHRYKSSLLVDHIRKFPAGKGLLYQAGLTLQELLQWPYNRTAMLDQMAREAGICWAEFLDSYQPYMTEDQVRRLTDQGFTVGAHSWDHPEFPLLTDDEQFLQVRQSMKWIVDRFNPAIKAFAFPFTDNGISGGLLRQIASEGICDVTFGTAGMKYDEHQGHFQRLPCETSYPLAKTLRSELAYNHLRKLFGRSTVKRRRP